MAKEKFTQLDFDKIRQNLKDFLSKQDRFKDYDFDGSNMSVLLDVLAYNTFQNNFYANMAFAEMFIDSAQLKDSIVSHAKELNYVPRSRRSARAVLDVNLSVTDGAKSVVIPRNTKFTAKCKNTTFSFYSEESVTIKPIDGIYKYEGLDVYEGTNVVEAIEVTQTNAIYPISNPNVDTNSIRVSVRDNTNEGSPKTEYLFKETIFGVDSDAPVHYIQAHENDSYAVAFGQNVFGFEPEIGQVVEISYRTTQGDAANGARNFTAAQEIDGYAAVVTTTTKAEGGSEREGIEAIRFFAPKSIQVQDRAITESDYEILLKNTFSEVQAVSVFGGEELDPPRYGRVVVAVDVKNADGVSETNKKKYREFLLKRCPIGIEPLVISPEFMFISVSSTVNFNIDITEKSSSEIESLVEDAIQTFSDEELSDFKKTFRLSRFVGVIDDADPSIVSNDSEVFAIIPTVPTLGVEETFILNFNNELDPDHDLSKITTLENYNYALKSSSFVYAGSRGFIQDDGIGNLHILRDSGDSFVYLKRNIGTINYETGEVRVSDLVVDSYRGSELGYFARTVSKDIVAPKDRIISIRPVDVTVTTNGVTTR